jgi:hypothetical protein
VLADLAQLEGGLLRGDAVNSEAALHIVEETEVLAGPLDGDDVCDMSTTTCRTKRRHALTHEAGGVGLVSPDLTVDLDEALLQD